MFGCMTGGNHLVMLVVFVGSCLMIGLQGTSSFPFSSFQVTFGKTNSPFYYSSTSSPDAGSFSTPATLAPSSTVSLSLAGYTFECIRVIEYQVFINPYSASDTTITLTVWTYSSTIIHTLSLNVLIVQESNEMFYLVNGMLAFPTTGLASYNSGTLSQGHAHMTTTPLSSPSSFKVKTFLLSFRAEAQATQNHVHVQIDVTTIDPSFLIVTAVRQDLCSQKISSLQYTILIINITAIQWYNPATYEGYFQLYTTPPSGPTNLFSAQAINFDIPDLFINGAGYQQYCTIGSSKLSILSNISTSQLREIRFDLSTRDPIQFGETLPVITYSGAINYYQYFRMDYQVLCYRECPSGTFYHSTYQCFDCLQECLTCLAFNICTQCVNNSYYLSVGHLCEECSSMLGLECLTCIADRSLSSYNCTSCTPTHFVNASNQCQSCASAIPNCLYCSTSTFCSTCNSPTLLFKPDSASCVSCSLQLSGCVVCSNNQCLQCSDQFYLEDGSCLCLRGQKIEQQCITIQGCLENIVTGFGEEICLRCDESQYQPVQGRCQCKNNATIVNAICNTIQGCITPTYNSQGILTCASCNVTAKMQLSSTATTCACIAKYELAEGQCSDICGDGYLMSSQPLLYCDDGNTNNNDGCSAACEVQTDYRCQNGSATGPSECVYIGQIISLSLSSIQRAQGLNQGFFYFTLSPSIDNINNMNFTHYLLFQCQDTSFTISSITFQNVKIAVVADYTEDMEDRSCQVTLGFDRSIALVPDSQVLFEVRSRNVPLVVSDYIQYYEKFKVIFNALGIAALGVFVLSLGHKMIGAELMTCCQIIYLSHCFYQTPSFLLTSLKEFDLVTGLWSLFSSDSDRELLFPFSERVQLSPLFIKSNLVVISTLFISALIWLLLISVHLYRNYTSGCQLKIQQPLVVSAINFIYKSLLFPITASFMVVLMISAYVGTLRQDGSQTEYSLLGLVNSLSQLFSWLMISGLFGLELTVSALRLRGQRGVRQWYIIFFWCRSIILGGIFWLGLYWSLPKTAYILLFIQCAYLTVLLGTRPYSSIFSKFSLVFNQCTSIYAIFLSILRNFIVPRQQYQLFLIFILQGLILLILVFTMIRVFLCYKSKACKGGSHDSVESSGHRSHVNDDKILKSKLASQLKNTLLREQTRTIPEGGKSDKDEQIIKIKKKLRSQFRMQKGCLNRVHETDINK